MDTTESSLTAVAAERSDTPRQTGQHLAHHQPARHFWTRLLESTDSLVYVLVGICFFLAALLSLAYGISKFGYHLSEILQAIEQRGLAVIDDPNVNAARSIIDLVSDLLLTLIIMEVLGTVVHYLRTRETSLKPFLFIGIVSATRGILAVGARLSVSETGTFSSTDFNNAMIELGVNAAVIIALGITMRLLGRFLDDRGARRRQGTAPLNGLQERHAT